MKNIYTWLSENRSRYTEDFSQVQKILLKLKKSYKNEFLDSTKETKYYSYFVLIYEREV